MTARAVTPLLHVGESVPFPHVTVENEDEAAMYICAGTTVVVGTDGEARKVLKYLGLSDEDIEFNIRLSHGDSDLAEPELYR